MYLGDSNNEMAYQGRPYGSMRRPPPPPTSIPLDDRFDAMTTDAPTEWDVGRRRQSRDYEESISGYRNYVNEMERMLGGEVDVQGLNTRGNATPMSPRKIQARQASPENSRILQSPTGSRRNLSGYASVDNLRNAVRRKASIELVEHKIMEDGPQRTITLWRERVAQSSGGRGADSRIDEEVGSEANSHTHRRMLSGESRGHRRMISEDNGNRRGESVMGSINSRGKEVTRPVPAKYERSEYIIAYQKPRKNSGSGRPAYTPSEGGQMSSQTGTRRTANPSNQTNPMSPRIQAMTNRSKSPNVRKTSGRASYDRSEYMITYPNTPPHSGSQPSSSSHRGQVAVQQRPMSPLQTRTYIPIDMADTASIAKSTTASPVELILSSCEPSLIHTAPILYDLGIHKLEHLRAVSRLSEETRDREVKEQALRRGMTVMEWAILLDKLQTL